MYIYIYLQHVITWYHLFMWNTMIVSDSNPFGRRVVAHSLRHMHLSEHGLPRSPRVNHHFPWKLPFWAAHPYFQSQPLSIPVLYCCIQFVCMYIYIIIYIYIVPLIYVIPYLHEMRIPGALTELLCSISGISDIWRDGFHPVDPTE